MMTSLWRFRKGCFLEIGLKNKGTIMHLLKVMGMEFSLSPRPKPMRKQRQRLV